MATMKIKNENGEWVNANLPLVSCGLNIKTMFYSYADRKASIDLSPYIDNSNDDFFIILTVGDNRDDASMEGISWLRSEGQERFCSGGSATIGYTFNTVFGVNNYNNRITYDPETRILTFTNGVIFNFTLFYASIREAN